MARSDKTTLGGRVRFRVLGLVPAPGPSGADLLFLTIGRFDGTPDQTFGVRAAVLLGAELAVCRLQVRCQELQAPRPPEQRPGQGASVGEVSPSELGRSVD